MNVLSLSRRSSPDAFANYNSYNIFERPVSRGELGHTQIETIYKQKIRLYKGLFTILFITTFITIFELVFYIIIIGPRIKEGIVIFINYDIDPRAQFFINTLKNRELYLIQKHKTKSYVVIIILILSLFIALVATYIKIKSLHHDDVYYTHKKNKLKFRDVAFYSFITIGILVCYQVIFYNFGLNYKYIGINEIVYKVLDKI